MVKKIKTDGRPKLETHKCMAIPIFDGQSVSAFFHGLARITSAPVDCEPRYGSWFDRTADRLLASLNVSRVAADPARSAAAACPGAAMTSR
jgi:hypothetical protein